MPAWVWLSTGLAIGLAVAMAIYVSDRRAPPPDTRKATDGPAAKAPATAAPPSEETVEERRFDFYELLPKFEVVIPEEDLDVVPDTVNQPMQSPGVYVLQAGSFSSFADADRMKARLALLGIVSGIQKVTVDDKAYHRVRIGPIKNLDELNNVRQQLRDARVEVLVIRVGD